MEKNKFYFFRDLEHQDNLLDGKTFHAAGYVDELFCEIGKPNASGKDVVVCFFEPFKGTIMNTWRALDEVELFEVTKEEYDAVAERYTTLDTMNKIFAEMREEVRSSAFNAPEIQMGILKGAFTRQ